MAESSLPDRARVVIVGGGIIGVSVAYHLTRLGWSDVVLIEQGQLSCGTTWHAAGIVGQLRTHSSLTKLMLESSRLYESLEGETGLGTGWNQSGAVWVASTPERMVQMRRTIDQATSQGLEAHEISVAEAAEKFPLMRTEDLVGAIWLPNDAKANPTDITQALAKGARAGGARIFERTKVTGFRTERGRVKGVQTSKGEIECEVVVNCGGQWANAIGAMAGVTVPLYPAEHFYIVTDEIEGLDRTTPTMRDPDGFTYFKEEVRGLLMGGFEPDAKPWVASDSIPEPFEFQLLEEDWEQFDILMRNAVHRVPAMERVGVKKFYNGPESFTPDHNFILGEAPELAGFFVGAGFNSSGMAFSGGAGSALARWIVDGEPDLDLTPVDIRRFYPFQGNSNWLRERVKEVVGLHFAPAWPNREVLSARPLRRSPVHHLLEAQGASYGSKAGWERPNWFAPPGVSRELEYSWGRPHWLAHSGAEHAAARNSVALFDQTSFAKIVARGPDVESALQYLCANDVDVPVGRTVYTGLLNERGGFEADLTVTRTAWDQYLVVTSSASGIHDLDVLRKAVDPTERVEFVDVSSAYAVFGVMGPRSRELLASLSRDDLCDAAFPFGSSRVIDLAGVNVRATRITYVGELGWELYVPSEFAVAAFERLTDRSNGVTPVHAGYYAIDSLRLEKGYRAWGRELTPDVSPIEAGLSFATKLRSGLEFRGREALAKQAKAGVTKTVMGLSVADPDAYAWGSELVLRNGVPVGFVTSAAFGHTIGQLATLALVSRTDGQPIDRDWIQHASYDVVIGGSRVEATASLQPFYDPTGARTRT